MSLALLLLVLGAGAQAEARLSQVQLAVNVGTIAPVGTETPPRYHVGPSGSVETSVFLKPWLRTSVLLGAAYLGELYRQFYPGDHGLFRLLVGGDVVYPLPSGSLFAGVSAGPCFSNWREDRAHVFHYPPDSYDTSFSWVFGARSHAGVEGLVSKRLVVGASLAYGLTWSCDRLDLPYHLLEFSLRVGMRF